MASSTRFESADDDVDDGKVSRRYLPLRHNGIEKILGLLQVIHTRTRP